MKNELTEQIALTVIAKEKFQKQSALMRHYAAEARKSKSGKYRGITAERAEKLADHHAAIASGEIAIGTPCAPKNLQK